MILFFYILYTSVLRLYMLTINAIELFVASIYAQIQLYTRIDLHYKIRDFIF